MTKKKSLTVEGYEEKRMKLIFVYILKIGRWNIQEGS